jgi:arabinan endo-1,5-alpha-L-arabinosidase
MKRFAFMSSLIMIALFLSSGLTAGSQASKFATSVQSDPRIVDGQASRLGERRALDAGLIAHYEFEGNADDSSGNDLDGTVSTGVTYGSGWIGQAVFFDGTPELRVSVPYDAKLDTDYQFTLSAWIYPTFYRNTGEDNAHVIISKWNTSAPPASASGDYHLTLTDVDEPGRLRLRVANTENGFVYDDVIGSNDLAAPLNRWSHVAAVFDNGSMQVYLNCQLAGSKVSTTVVHTELDRYLHDNLTIGNLWTNMPNEVGFIGSIDEARLYDRPLSKQEICRMAMKQVLLPVVVLGE